MPRPDPEERKRLILRYQTLADGIASILFRRDPIGIGSTIDNPHHDEYASEAASIARSLPDIVDLEALQFTIREVFVLSFAEDLAGPEAGDKALAEEIWSFAKEVGKAS